MAQFYTGEALADKLTDIIWNAKKELLILSPFIHLDDYCKEVFKNYKHDPELEVVLVFGKNEREAGKSLNKNDLDFFKEFKNITIIYCKDLHAKFYSNEKEGLLTSLNLLDKCMVKNIEYGIYFTSSLNPIDKLYEETVGYTNDVILTSPCIYVKRPQFKKELFGFKKTYVSSEVLWDVTDELYQNRKFPEKLYDDFKGETNISKESKPKREEFQNNVVKDKIEYKKPKEYNNTQSYQQYFGFCIRTGVKIPFDVKRPFSLEAYYLWANFENWNYRENYCHKTGENSNGRTSMAEPILYKNR
ncbi:hypothetical protein [Flavobacterium sp. ZB4P13]|uniref:hypothetical protein n=1 Tax=Flavobacterium sp. ZB4P13 TaxID=3401728 RepID=UPI003AAABF37